MFCGSPKSQVADRGLKPQRRSGSNAALKRRSSTGLRIAIYKAAIGRCTRLQLAMRETATGHPRGCGPPCARLRLVISQGRQLDGVGRQQVPRRFAPRNDKDSKTCRNQSIAALRLVPSVSCLLARASPNRNRTECQNLDNFCHSTKGIGSRRELSGDN